MTCRKKNVGKPCEGEPHARFDEGRVNFSPAYSTDYGTGTRAISPSAAKTS